MRFRRVIIPGNGFGARRIRAVAGLIGIILINAITLNAQVAPPGQAARSEAIMPQHNDRILRLLAALADQASRSGDLTFAVRAQSHAATLLWPYDRERARAIYRRAFGSLMADYPSKCDDSATPNAAFTNPASRLAPTAVARQELLHEIAGRDPGLAEELVLAFKAAVTDAIAASASATMSRNRDNGSGPALNRRATSAYAKREVEWRDLLASVAFQIVERDPARAARLAGLSLAGGVWPHFSRLLLSLRAADAGRADLLFAYAVGCLERSEGVELNGLHALGAFLVSATDPIAEKPLESDLVARYLNCALAQAERRGQMAAGWQGDVPANQGIDDEDEAVIYFMGRQLGDLFARYLPNRLGQFKRKIAELNAANAARVSYWAVDPAQVYASDPNEIAPEASGSSTAADRDLLYARAAFACLARGEIGRAQAAAVKVAATALHDRVLVEIARRYNSAGRFDGAVAVARRIEDAAARASFLTNLAGAALASKDGARAAGLLDEAARYALAARPSMARVLTLSEIARSFTRFDVSRGFEIMQAAIEAINAVVAQKESSEPEGSSSGAVGANEPSELFGSSFEAAFAALGRADFQRALSLPQQLAARDIAVLAQLAVCRGGLAAPS